MVSKSSRWALARYWIPRAAAQGRCSATLVQHPHQIRPPWIRAIRRTQQARGACRCPGGGRPIDHRHRPDSWVAGDDNRSPARPVSWPITAGGPNQLVDAGLLHLFGKPDSERIRFPASRCSSTNPFKAASPSPRPRACAPGPEGQIHRRPSGRRRTERRPVRRGRPTSPGPDSGRASSGMVAELRVRTDPSPGSVYPPRHRRRISRKQRRSPPRPGIELPPHGPPRPPGLP